MRHRLLHCALWLALGVSCLLWLTVPSVARAYCGDAVLEAGEGCDDGARTSDDGCDLDCVVEVGWQCSGSPSACGLIGTCGDGVVEGLEQCDDGNTVSSDGCSAGCRTEACGDGVVQSSEGCDDYNLADGDGCSSTCTVETGYACTVTTTSIFIPLFGANTLPSMCRSTCGDGVLASDEECDDNDLVTGDGCNEFCLVEGCGNRVLEPGEECEDGNLVDGDGCSSSCTVETGYYCDTGGCIPITACDNSVVLFDSRGPDTTWYSRPFYNGDSDSDGRPEGLGWDWVFIYANVPAFTLNVGDTIALDAYTTSGTPITTSIELAPALTNGSSTGEPAGPFTTVVSSTSSTSLGNDARGDHDLVFTADAGYTHPGGGLLMRLRPTSGDTYLVLSNGTKSAGIWRDDGGVFPWDTQYWSGYSALVMFYTTAPVCTAAGYRVGYTRGGDCDGAPGECTPPTKSCWGVERSCGTGTTCSNCDVFDPWYVYSYNCCDATTGGACTCYRLLERNPYCNVNTGGNYRGYSGCSLSTVNTYSWTRGCTSCDDANACTNDFCDSGPDVCVNEALPDTACYTGPVGTEGVGQCQGGLESCTTPGACIGEVLPSTDVCDGIDNDCNGVADDPASADVSCDDANPATVDTCVAGGCQNVLTCTQTDTDCGTTTCQDCNLQDGWYVTGASFDCCDGVGSSCTCTPSEQRDYFCDGLAGACSYTAVASNVDLTGCTACTDADVCTDDTCDGLTGLCAFPNNTYAEPCYTGPAGTEGVGSCAAGSRTCAGGVFGACTDVTPAAEACDSLDNDCDGVIDDGADAACGAGQACVWGSCYNSCTLSTDCAGGESCYDDNLICNDSTDACVGITCPSDLVCVKGECFPPCSDDGDCVPPLLCFNGYCALSACDGIQCPVEDVCHLGECYPPCDATSDCTSEACQLYETCTDGTCDTYCSTDPCAGVVCPAGPPAEVCRLGSCFPPCGDDGDCVPPLVCFNGTCVDAEDPCDTVHCEDGMACHLGQCFPTCEYDAECPGDEKCQKGTCVSTACDPDPCPTGMTCKLGECFPPCGDDGDCTPPNRCFDKVCAPNACAAYVEPANYPYHVEHPFTRSGRWVTARQSTIPKIYPMPVETTDVPAWTTGTSPASAPKKARLVLLFDETEADAENPAGRYVLWLTQGADDPTQGEGIASYTIRWQQGVDASKLKVEGQDPSLTAVGATLGTPHLHQIQVNNAAGAAGGVRIGSLPASLDVTIRIDAEFAGDIAGWELYNGATGWVVPLDPTEPLTLRMQASGDPDAIVTPELGGSCVPDDPGALGVCSRGAYDRCRNGELFCLASVTPWAHETCDGADNNCNGYIDEPSAMQVPMVYVRQSGNPGLETWTLLPTDDRATSVIDALDFAAVAADVRVGRTDFLYPDGSPAQVTDGMRTAFYRDMRTGALNMPVLAGADEASVAVRALPETMAVDVSLLFGGYGSFSDQMHLIWWDDRADDGPLLAATAPSAVDDATIRTTSELRWVPMGTSPTDPAHADADALVWRSAMQQGGTMGEVVFAVDVATDVTDLGLATASGTVLPLLDAPFEVKLVATPLADSMCYDGAETSTCKYGRYTCSVGALTCAVSETVCACQDADGDGFDRYDPFVCPTGTDCDDADETVAPGAAEVCDDVDNDCDGRIDATRRPVDPAAPTACPTTTPAGGVCGPSDCDFRVNACVCAGPGNCYCEVN